MAKKKDGLLPVFIVMAALLVVSIGFLAGYNAWVNRELTPEEDAAQVAIVYNDNDGNSQSITKGEVQDAYTEAATMYQMNYGTTSGYESQILNEALSAAISDRIVPLKAQELGLDEVTDEERATMEETAQSQLDSTVDSYIASYLTEEQQALSEEEQRQIALDALAAEGVDFDYAYEQQLSALYETRVFEAATADVTPTDEELHTYYEEQLASDTEMYDEAWYYALTAQYGQTSLWAPEGVRIVKHILLDPGEELKEAYSTASSALNSALSSIENTQAEIAELEAEINGTDETAEDAAAEATATPAPTATLDPSATPEPSPEEQLAAAQHGDAGVDDVLAPGKGREHAHGVVMISRLAEDGAVEIDDRVRRDNDVLRRAGLRDLLRLVQGQFAHGLLRAGARRRALRALCRPDRQVRHAEHLQQLPPARGAGG